MALYTAVLVLNILWQVGVITSGQTGALSWIVPWSMASLLAMIVPVLVLVLVVTILPTTRAVYKVAPTTRGLALRTSLIASRVIPWSDIRWRDPTHVEWIQLVGTGRAVVTPEQSQRIYRWFRPS